MKIVITGRRTEVSDRFRQQAEEKLAKISQFAPRAHRVDVELSHERNPRQADICEKVEITVRDRGPVIRAEACAEEPVTALDLAFAKLLERLRRLGDRRKVHHGRQTPASLRVRPSIPSSDETFEHVPSAPANGSRPSTGELDVAAMLEPGEFADGPLVIRTKDHTASPMTLDQALYEMELIGHDFFLFVDATSGRPCVVYRRHGYHYGVIRLQVDQTLTTSTGLPTGSSGVPADSQART